MNAATDHTGRGPRYLVLLATLVVTSMVLGLVAASPAHGAGNSLNAKTCQKSGWATVVTMTGAKFANEEACVSYAAKGGTLKRAQTVSFISADPSPATVGSAYTPAASATSGLPVAITIDPASSSVCSKSGAVVTFDDAGTCTIDASQAGNATYNAAPRAQQSITVTKRAQTISFISADPSPAAVGSAYTPAASATSGLPATITIDPASSSVCSKSGAVVTFDAAGTCTIDASQSGNTAYDAAAQVQQSITVTNPVNPSQAVCEASGGTFGLGPVWSCKTLPAAVGSDFSPLQNRCQADGGVGFVALPTLAGGYDTWCFATAIDALLFAVSGAVQAVLIATWNS
jgi:hypothetical protein